MAAHQKQTHQDVLARLVQDLKEKKKLCRVKDYPGVTLEQLNRYVKKHGPLVNPVIGEQPAFFVDQGRFTPRRMVTYGGEKVVTKITQRLANWAETSPHGGRVTGSQGAFILDQTEDGPDVNMPDVVYTPRDDDRNLAPAQVWTYRGDPFVPTFVVEVDKLSGRGSRRKALDDKMRNEYFSHGVQLGWLIDPRPDFLRIYEYFLDENGEVQRSDDSSWRNLNGRDVLPGFRIRSRTLEMALNQEPGSSEDERLNITCQIPGCGKRLRSIRENAAHGLEHLEDRAIAQFEAKRARR